MKKFVLAVFLLMGSLAIAQVGIGNTNPQSSLDISASNVATPSNTDGILIPRIDNFPATDPGAAQDGMMVFATGNGTPSEGFYYWDNGTTSWIAVGGSGAQEINDLSDGKSDNDGSNNGSSVFLGVDSGASDDSSNNRNVGVGYQTLQNNTSGSDNVGIGSSALNANTTGNGNVGVGASSLSANTTGSSNVGVGLFALNSNTTGAGNVAVGLTSLRDNTTGNYNVALGMGSLLSNTTGENNISLGWQSMVANTTGQQNVAVGRQSLSANTTGALNTAIGDAALDFNTTGIRNVAVGSNALVVNTTGQSNVALGPDALNANVSGNENVAIGYEAGDRSTGNGNVYLGAYSGHLNTASNRLFIETDITEAATPLIYGEFDNDVLRTYGELQVGNPTGTGYALPTTDGTAGQVLQTDGAGQLAFATAADTDTQNTLDGAYDEGGAGAGRVITADTGALSIQGADGIEVTGTFGSGATIGTPGAGTRMFFNPNTASFRAGNVNGTQWDETNLGDFSAAFNINTTAQAYATTVFGRWNVLGGTTDSWVSSEPLFIVGNGTNNANRSNAFIVEKDGRTGIGIDNPASALHIGISTTFDLSPINTGQDGLYIIGTGDNSGNNAIGPSIGFAPPRTNRMNQRKAAISSVQTSGDEDHVGLAFYVHGNGINISDMVERMRLSHQGYLGLNNTSPDATLDVVGTMQFVDGNEAAGYVLSSDATGNASWVDPSTIFNDTDDQTIDVLNLSGTTLNISLEDDGVPNQTVDLSSLQDGTGTDDQTIDVFNLSGTTLNLSLEDDGVPTQTVDLSSLQNSDADWYEVGGTSSPNDINDSMYTQGDVGIGTITPNTNYNLTSSSISGAVEVLVGPQSTTFPVIDITSSNNSSNGIEIDLTSTSNANGTNRAAISATTPLLGVNTLLNFVQSSPANTVYGVRNDATLSGTTMSYTGYYNSISGTSSSNAINHNGFYNFVTSDITGLLYGVHNRFLGGGNGVKYGLYNLYGGSSAGTQYGAYTFYSTNSSNNLDKYGYFVDIPDGNGGTHYGVYSDVTKSGSYAGYFLGAVSIGTTTANEYILPASRGSNGQVMQTDGAGNVSWATISTSDATTASNGLTETGDDVQLGGVLAQNTTITQGNFGMTYNLTGTGDFIVQDSGTDAFIVEDTGDVGFGLANPFYQVDIDETDNSKNIALRVTKTETSSGNNTGIAVNKTANGTGESTGLSNNITGSGNGEHRGVFSLITSSGTGTKLGTYNRFTTSATGLQYGVQNVFDGATTSAQRGLVNDFSFGSNTQQGMYNVFTSTATTGSEVGAYNVFNNGSTAEKFGTVAIFGTAATGNHTGAEYTFSGTTNTSKKGLYVNFANSTVGTLYGVDVNMTSTDSGTKYGVRVNLSNNVTGSANYGIYSNVNTTDGWAGYYLGRNYISNRLSIGEIDNANAGLNVRGNSSSTYSQIEIEETTVNDGARMRFTNATETTNNWLLFGRADNTISESRFSINHTTTGNIIHIRGDGRVGINNSAPTYALELPNSATVSVGQARANAWVTYSDGRVKKGQKELSYGLSEILKINPKSYTQFASEFDEGELLLKEGTESREIGFIAQELYDIIPEATFKPENEDESLWSVNYEKIIPVAVNAIKELNTKVESLSEENKKLKDQLALYAELEARIEALEIKGASSDSEKGSE